MKKLLLTTAFTSLVFLNGAETHIDLLASFLKTNYKEYQGSNVIDGDHSSYSDMVGANVDIYQYFDTNDRLFIGIEYNEGSTIYNGQTSDGTSLTLKENDSFVLNSRLIYESYLTTYEYDSYIENMYFDYGIGYRYWDRGLSNYPGDYREKYKWPYFILGFTATETFAKFDYETTFIYHRAISPEMEADLGNGAIYDLGKTDGYRFELPIRYHLGKNYGISFKYTYDYWKIHKSDRINVTINNKVYSSYEPDSKTKNQYLSIGFYINF